MKCKGKISVKNKQGKTIEKNCFAQLNVHDIFCPYCGTATQSLSTELSAQKNLQFVWNKYKPIKSKYYPFSIFLIFTGFLLLVATIYFGIRNYWQTNAGLLFVVPFLLVPFATQNDLLQNPPTIKNYFQALKYYPHFWLFTLINIAYFLFIKIICTGFILNIPCDPLLHFARFILIVYWIVIVMPVPLLIIRKKLNVYKAIKIAYEAGKETRWQQFFTLFFVLIINSIGLALFGVGLIVSIPLSYILIERYYQKIDEFELFDHTKS